MVENIASLAAYCALMSGTPGPNNVMLATSGANFGYRRTLPYLLGVNAGVFSLTFGLSIGIAAAFSQYPQIQEVLKFTGGLYLVYLAWKLAGAGAVTQPDVQKPLTFLDGAVFQFVNPKTWVRAATISTVFLPPTLSPAGGALYVSGLGFVIGFPLISVWTLFGVCIREFLQTSLRLRVFNGVMGLGLLALAVSLLFS